MLKVWIHGVSSTNCMPWAVASKRAYRGSATRKPAIAPARASQRARLAFRSEPVKSTAMPARMGSQMTVLSRVFAPMSASCEPEREQHEHADDHGEGIVVDQAGLQFARDSGEPAHQPRRAIDEDTVDER